MVTNFAQIRSAIQAECERQGCPSDLAIALMRQESALNPYAVSKVGAMGLGQLMPATAIEVGVKDPFDPSQNIRGSVKYLMMMLKRFGGSERLAVASYNAGPSAVERYKGIPPFRETQDYVKRIGDRLGRAYKEG